MLRLLTIELHKLKYNKSAKAILIVYFILITFIALISSIEFNFGDFHFRIADQGIFKRDLPTTANLEMLKVFRSRGKMG